MISRTDYEEQERLVVVRSMSFKIFLILWTIPLFAFIFTVNIQYLFVSSFIAVIGELYHNKKHYHLRRKDLEVL